MKEKRGPKFIVRPEKGADKPFNDAFAASLFLWGKDLKKYAVYTRQDDLPSNLDELRIELQRSEGERGG